MYEMLYEQNLLINCFVENCYICPIILYKRDSLLTLYYKCFEQFLYNYMQLYVLQQLLWNTLQFVDDFEWHFWL